MLKPAGNTNLGVPSKSISQESLVISGSRVKGNIKWFVEELVIGDIVTDMDHLIILVRQKSKIKL